MAIIEYLHALYPEPRMIPAGSIERARAMGMVLTIACDIHPSNNLRVLQYLEHDMGQDKAAIDAWYRHWVEHALATLEALVPDAPFADGDLPNIVDACRCRKYTMRGGSRST